MDEKKSIKVSLGTTICIFIILLLIVALGVVYYLGYVRNNQEILALKNEVSVLKENNNITSNEKESYKTNEDATKNSIIGTYKLDKEDAKKFGSFVTYDCKVVLNSDNSCSIYEGEFEYEGDKFNVIFKGTYSANEKTVTCNMEKGIVFEFNIIDAKTIQLKKVNEEPTNGDPNVPIFKVGTKYINSNNLTASSIDNSDKPYFNDFESLPQEIDDTVIEKIVIPAGFEGFNGGAGEIYNKNGKKILVSGEIGPNNYEWTVLYNDTVIIKYSGNSYSYSYDGAPNDHIIYVLKDYVVCVKENETGLVFGFEIFDAKGNKIYSKNDNVIKIYYKETTNLANSKDPIIIYKNQIYFILRQNKDSLYYININNNNLKEVKICDL